VKCPYCGDLNNKVIDSRASKDDNAVRRRRECLSCSHRFTTYERLEEQPIVLIKKDGRREVFDRNKILAGIQKACQKRPISINTIEEFVDDLERKLYDTCEKEIASSFIGEHVMEKLHVLDPVAYVRFASVYREFRNVNDFVGELKNFLNGQKEDNKS
jgi:transcriptional repressor NrdR